MIDSNGYRANVGMILANQHGKLLWTRRVGHPNSWQFAQGGINDGESAEHALYRELHEELGLSAHHVVLLGQTQDWLYYRLPTRYIREQTPRCIGQKQRWFLLYLDEKHTDAIDFNLFTPEFDAWRWVSYWYPVGQIVPFKRVVYQRALSELLPYLQKIKRLSN